MDKKEFLKSLENPEKWIEMYKKQKLIGDSLVDIYTNNVEFYDYDLVNTKSLTKTNRQNNGNGDIDFWINSLYHYGIAMENGFKAIVIKKSPDKVEFKEFEDLIIMKKLGINISKGHSLIDFANLINLRTENTGLNNYEEEVLKLLAILIKWGARYPIPLNSQDDYIYNDVNIPAPVLFGFHILDIIFGIFKFIDKELNITQASNTQFEK